MQDRHGHDTYTEANPNAAGCPDHMDLRRGIGNVRSLNVVCSKCGKVAFTDDFMGLEEAVFICKHCEDRSDPSSLYAEVLVSTPSRAETGSNVSTSVDSFEISPQPTVQDLAISAAESEKELKLERRREQKRASYHRRRQLMDPESLERKRALDLESYHRCDRARREDPEEFQQRREKHNEANRRWRKREVERSKSAQADSYFDHEDGMP